MVEKLLSFVETLGMLPTPENVRILELLLAAAKFRAGRITLEEFDAAAAGIQNPEEFSRMVANATYDTRHEDLSRQLAEMVAREIEGVLASVRQDA